MSTTPNASNAVAELLAGASKEGLQLFQATQLAQDLAEVRAAAVRFATLLDNAKRAALLLADNGGADFAEEIADLQEKFDGPTFFGVSDDIRRQLGERYAHEAANRR
jgi:hypothetical protein